MTETSWGIRFNEHPDYQRVPKGQKPVGCPEWLASHQILIWQEQGLIIWNNNDKKIENLLGAEAVKLLSELTTQDTWKSSGVSITRLVYRFEISSPSRRKQKKGESAPDAKKTKSEPAYEEILHLPPEAGYELINLLESKGSLLPRWQIWKRNAFKRR